MYSFAKKSGSYIFANLREESVKKEKNPRYWSRNPFITIGIKWKFHSCLVENKSLSKCYSPRTSGRYLKIKHMYSHPIKTL
jgi:hypothetical protein